MSPQVISAHIVQGVALPEQHCSASYTWARLPRQEWHYLPLQNWAFAANYCRLQSTPRAAQVEFNFGRP
jgi:hypothetical protein